MTEWWDSLNSLQRIFAYIAVPSTAILIIQTIMLLVGLGGHGDFDGDSGGDSFDGDSGGDSFDGDSGGDGFDGDSGGDGFDGDSGGDSFDGDSGGDTDSDSDSGGASDGDSDGDSVGGHGDSSGGHIGSGLRPFTLRGIVAMLAIGGWSGIVMVGAGVRSAEAIALSVLFGLVTLFGMAYMMKLMVKMQQSGNLELHNAIGHTGQVYIPIPPALTRSGKITITFQNTFSELSAVTPEKTRIATGETVRVTGTDDDGMLVVERVQKEDGESR